MAAESYDEALRRLLAHEGGYANHPNDPGGPTKYGITIGDYRRYVKADATEDDIRAMPLQHAKSIYRARYWSVLRCDDLPAGLDYAVFDYGVHSGVARAAKVMRRLLGLPAGTAMSADVVAAAAARDAADLVTRLCAERLAFLKSLRTWPVFGKGWERRVAEVKSAALAMAGRTRVAAPRPAPPSGTRAGGLKERLKGWRTILFGALVAVASAVADILDAMQAVDLAPLLPPAHALKIIAVIGLATILLRIVTTGRVGQKDQ